MKKSILALGAAAAVAGFAGVAHAEGFIGAGTATTATDVQLAPSGVGQYLFAPYFTTQKDNNTLLSVVNTDTVNGKAVKVRFRGAANSDDVMDFTVFLSPEDVWTASLVQGADGLTQISTPDTSCTLPQVIKNQPFATFRLQSDLTDAQKAEHTREGYVEILNMADVKPGSTLFKNIKHKNGVAPCDYDAFSPLTAPGWFATNTAAELTGLAAPTATLFGGWQLVKLSNISTYSGTHTAVATVGGPGNIAFVPQREETIGDTANLAMWTADPLFRAPAGGGNAPLNITWQDLPDMSTPLFGTSADLQAANLSEELAKVAVKNEFVSTIAGASVPGNTDWVVSQPTRRYNVALNYASKTMVFNQNVGYYGSAASNRLSVRKSTLGFGNFICTGGALKATDREEAGAAVSFSPSPTATYCGEVFVLSFNDAGAMPSQVLSANLAKQTVQTKYTNGKTIQAGWATLTLDRPASNTVGLPIVGFAATSLLNQTQNGNYGYTLQHRW